MALLCLDVETMEEGRRIGAGLGLHERMARGQVNLPSGLVFQYL